MFTIGADPEVFAKKDGSYVSAWGMIPGDKKNPYPVRNGAVQVDGMALEFNIDPSADEESFCFNINSVLSQLRELVPEYEVVADPVAKFSDEYMRSQPEQALELGCDPDYNAYTGRENTKPDNQLPMRTAAGHVHIGFGEGLDGTEGHFELCCNLTQQLDIYLGLVSLLYDKDQERRSMYGKAGAFRPKSYGLEYRVLSNKWLSNDNLIRWVFRATMNALQDFQSRPLWQKYNAQEIINSGDVNAARDIIEYEGLLIPTEEGRW